MNKIVLNTIILYIKIVLNMVLSFISVPIVLRALGAEDYGLYALVAGVVAMLAFLNSSMTVSTQRYLSVTMGTGNVNKVTEVFSCSLYLHLLIGLIVCVLFELVALFAFDGFLNIPQGRVETAKIIYQFLVLSTFFTIISVPYDAALNAHENMLVFSLITIIGALLRLALAVSLLHIHVDKLMVYGAGLAFVSLVEVLLKRIYVAHSYAEMKRFAFKELNRSLFKEMFSFAGWNTFGAFAMVCRNQGIAVVLNVFLGTIVNAAYGVANQVNGVLSNFSNSLQKAIAPQLMQKEGANLRANMFSLSFVAIKLSIFVFGLLSIPLIIEMEYVLKLWLQLVPENTIMFCRFILAINLFFQFSSGVALAIDAVGQIKYYRLVLSLVLFLNLPAAVVLLKYNYPVISVFVVLCVVELLCTFVRLFFAYKIMKFPIREYLKCIMLPFMLMFLVAFFVGWLEVFLFSPSFVRLCVVVLSTTTIMIIGTYRFLLCLQERLYIKHLLANILNKYLRIK